ncbi:MAG: AAA family ATPase, partial [Pseudomonadota bacterium]
CVLWIDELEKGIAVGNDNSGTAQRVLGSFLTWMNDRQESVFVVATANDISALPPELVRKGRFDEIFFVDLPRRTARADIMRLHLERRDLNPDDFDLGALAAQTRGFSGAEIEQLIVSSLYSAYATHQDVDTSLLLAEAKATRPLSVVMAENVDALRRWAAVRAVPSD